jgi:serine phosphatase RsbU (regulator of sigma subunit)/PAS domain-containing protein
MAGPPCASDALHARAGTERAVVDERTTAVDLDDPARLSAARRLVPPLRTSDTLQTLASLAARLLGTSYAQVSLVADVHRLVAVAGRSCEPVDLDQPRDDTFCAVTTRGGRPLEVHDASTDVRVAHLPCATSGRVGAYLGVPLVASEGQVVGALCAYDEQPRAWAPMSVTVLQELATAVVAELERIALAAERETVQVRLDLAMEAAGVGSWDWDLRSGELVGDDRMRRIFAGADSMFDGTLEEFDRRVHPEDLPRVHAALRAAVEHDEEYDEVYRLTLPDTSVRWISARGRALRDDTGTVVRVLGAASDITRQHRAEQETATARSLLELVAAAGRVLTDSLEVEHSVHHLARLVVPALADWSIVSLVGTDGMLHDVESWHRDEALRPAVAQLAAHRLDALPFAGALGDAMVSRAPVFVESGGAARAQRILRSPQALEAARQLGHESLAVFPLRVRDEVVGMLTLARGPERPPLGGAEVAAAKEVAERAGTALQHAQSFSRMRDFAEQLQRSLLTEPADPEGMEIAVLYTPASQAARVGGDWYDSFLTADGSTMLVVGDVIGHDSAAAAAMGQLRSLTRGIAYSTGASPAGVLSQVARAMEGLDIDTIATAIVAQLNRDPVTGSTRMTWSNAGHPPALVLHPDGGADLLEHHDLLLGLVADEVRTDHEVTLAPGSRVLLFTDGLVERRGENVVHGLARVQSVVRDARHLALAELVAHVHREMVPREPDDDVAVLALEVGPGAQSRG